MKGGRATADFSVSLSVSLSVFLGLASLFLWICPWSVCLEGEGTHGLWGPVGAPGGPSEEEMERSSAEVGGWNVYSVSAVPVKRLLDERIEAIVSGLAAVAGCTFLRSSAEYEATSEDCTVERVKNHNARPMNDRAYLNNRKFNKRESKSCSYFQ